MPLGTHRQRVPAMLAVACVGMLFYAVAGAAPDGRELPAPSTRSTTEKADKGATDAAAKDGCRGSTTSTTKKGDSDSTTDTTRKGGSGSTPTTDKDDKPSSTTTTEKDEKDDSRSKDAPDAKTAAASDPELTTAAAAKGDSGSGAAGKDCDDSTTTTTEKDGKGSTPTTEKGGKGSTTTTRKGGGGKNSSEKDSTTTTTTTERRRDRDRDGPTTTTTNKDATVDPHTPDSGDPGSGGSTDPGEPDPGANPIEPQEVPDDSSAPDPGSAADPEAAADPGSVEGDGSYDLPADGPFDSEGYAAVDSLAMPEAEPSVLPMFDGDLYPRPNGRPAVTAPLSRPSGRVQQLAAPPLVVPLAAPGVTESSAVSRQLPGLQTSVTESAFPGTVISTPKVFPMNRRDPLAAGALVLLVGVSRELFRAWRRQAASRYWPA